MRGCSLFGYVAAYHRIGGGKVISHVTSEIVVAAGLDGASKPVFNFPSVVARVFVERFDDLES